MRILSCSTSPWTKRILRRGVAVRFERQYLTEIVLDIEGASMTIP